MTARPAVRLALLTLLPASVALAWLRDRPGVVAPLASARSLAQLPAITAALDLALAPEEAERLTRLSDAVA